MASENSIENQSSVAWKPVAGSLQAMNLGSMPLSQLGQLVNWRNEQTYTIPACKPWVDLPLAATDPGNVSAPAASAPVEPTKPTDIIAAESVSQPVAPPEVAVAAPTLDSSANDAALQAAKAQELAEAAAKEAAAASELAEAEKAAAKAKAAADLEVAAAAQAAEAAARDAAAKEAAALEAAAKVAAAKEAAAREAAAIENAAREAAAKQNAQTKAAEDSAPIEPPAPSPLSESTVTKESAAEPIPDPPKVTTAAKETKSAVAPKTSSSAASQTESNRSSENQPTRARSEPLSSHLNDIVPIVPSNLRSPRNESSGDEYLLQLERLVLELNMELGRSRGEPKPVDPIEQMANRIIALNLENLALREKLQRTLNAS